MLPLPSLPVATRRLSLLPTYRFTNPSSHHHDFHADLPPGIFAAAVSVAADFQSSRVLIRLRESISLILIKVISINKQAMFRQLNNTAGLIKACRGFPYAIIIVYKA
ncbi:hypothetical protein OIU76_001088 [Salix suchowensis]|nr:hypothetical protein OIU76_001088 [Salix suchowensis]